MTSVLALCSAWGLLKVLHLLSWLTRPVTQGPSSVPQLLLCPQCPWCSLPVPSHLLQRPLQSPHSTAAMLPHSHS